MGSAQPPPDGPAHVADGPTQSSQSVHSLQAIPISPDAFNESTEPPPPYSDIESAPASVPVSEITNFRVPLYEIPGGRRASKARFSSIVTFSQRLCTSSESLSSLVRAQAHLHPKQVVTIRGWHYKTRKGAEGKPDTKESITDFDICMYLDEQGWMNQHTHLVVVPDGQKAYRGGRMKSTTRTSARPAGVDDAEFAIESRPFIAASSTSIPSDESLSNLDHYCDAFCADPSPLKSFTFTRTVTNLDQDRMRAYLLNVIAAVGYHGHSQIGFELEEPGFTVYSPHVLNRLRANFWVWWTCVILQLWIITWPILWWLTSRYEVCGSDSKYALVNPENGTTAYFGGGSEADWVMTRQAVLKKALLQRRNGWAVMYERLITDQMPRTTGNQLADNALFIASGITSMIQGSDEARGWGYDC